MTVSKRRRAVAYPATINQTVHIKKTAHPEDKYVFTNFPDNDENMSMPPLKKFPAST